jgi:hypothetical protein
MEASGQLQAPAALPLGKETGCAPESVLTLWREKNIISYAGNRSPVLQPVGRRYNNSAIPAPI